jgi:hypothetical protein
MRTTTRLEVALEVGVLTNTRDLLSVYLSLQVRMTLNQIDKYNTVDQIDCLFVLRPLVLLDCLMQHNANDM